MSAAPLSLRDYVAYATAGSFAVAAGFIAWRGDISLRTPSGITAILAAPAVYVIGHVIAELTTIFAGTKLNPFKSSTIEEVLAGAAPKGARAPLPDVLLDRIKEAAANYELETSEAAGRSALRNLAGLIVRMEPPVAELLGRWSMLEDFARNTAASLCVSGGMLAVGSLIHWDLAMGLLAVASLVAAEVLRRRYLRFQHLYWSRLLVAFAEMTLGTFSPTTTED